MSGDEIEQRLRGVETCLVEIKSTLATKLATLGDTVAAIDSQIFGTHHDNPGLVLRVDRIESTERLRQWFSRTALGAALTALVGMLWKHFFSEH